MFGWRRTPERTSIVMTTIGPFSLERVVNAVEKVRQRLLKAAAALRAADVAYAVIGGNAVALWVSRVDEAAVRNTQDVDILIRREDFDAARAALERTGAELDRAQEMPFGATFRASRAACFPLLDLTHHHGQICYLQSLLGDSEMHWDEAAITDEFVWKGDG